MKAMILSPRQFTVLAVTSALLTLCSPGPRAADGQSAAEKERQLIGILTTGATPAEKAITCKRLAIYGTKDAVPALAPPPPAAPVPARAATASPDPPPDGPAGGVSYTLAPDGPLSGGGVDDGSLVGWSSVALASRLARPALSLRPAW